MADPDFPKGGRRIEPPPGLPAGWEALEKQFLSGPKAGDLYVRFQGGPKTRHKNVCTVKQAVVKDADDRGIDVDMAVMEYDTLKAEAEAKKEQERMAKGKCSKEVSEQAVLEFEAKFGKLEAAVVPLIPGWTYATKWLPTSQQTHVIYYGPDMTSYGTVKAVEVVFGLRLLKGETLEVIDEAREAFIKKHGSLNPGYNPLRRTADGGTLADAVKAGDMDKVTQVEKDSTATTDKLAKLKERSKKKRRRDFVCYPVPSDYLESKAMAAVSSTSESGMRAAPEAAELAKTLIHIHKVLVSRGFPSSSTSVVVYKNTAEEQPHLEMIAGIYHQMTAPFNERPCFQCVHAAPDTKTGIGCKGLYMFWNVDSERWQIGKLGGKGAVCLAHCSSNKPSPIDLQQPWMLLRSDFAFQ